MSSAKGQFFLIGAVAICLLLFFGLSPVVRLTETTSGSIEKVAENIEYELPHVLGLGLNSSDSAGTMINFTNYAISVAEGRGADTELLWVLFEPSISDVNVTAGNFMDSSKALGINVSGTYDTLYVDIQTQNSTNFTVAGYTFDLEIHIDGDLFAAEVLTNKTSLYSLISVSDGDNSVRKEILA